VASPVNTNARPYRVRAVAHTLHTCCHARRLDQLYVFGVTAYRSTALCMCVLKPPQRASTYSSAAPVSCSHAGRPPYTVSSVSHAYQPQRPPAGRHSPHELSGLCMRACTHVSDRYAVHAALGGNKRTWQCVCATMDRSIPQESMHVLCLHWARMSTAPRTCSVRGSIAASTAVHSDRRIGS